MSFFKLLQALKIDENIAMIIIELFFANFISIKIAKYMKFLSLLFLTFFFFLGTTVYAQSDLSLPKELGQNYTLFPTTVLEDGERVPWVLLPNVHVYGFRRFATEEDRKNYNRLRYNVLKVLPYARLAQQKYDQLQRDLAMTSNKKEQKKLVKVCEQEIKGIFNKEIKNMSVTQGKILLKLIDRETGNSSFDVVKELRGGVSAFFYQSLARVFGHNLKNEYDVQQDRDIENIIRTHDRVPTYY